MFYIFHGEDDFTRGEELARLRARVMEDGAGELNISAFDGRTLSVMELINASSTLPFFSERRLIVVTDMLQQFEKRSSGHAAEEAERLIQYLPTVPETTRLVFDESVTLATNRGILRKAQALPNGYIRAFPRLNTNRREDAERLRKWIAARGRAKGKGIDPSAVDKLIEYVGTDLRQLDAELDKLAAHAGYAREIRSDDVVDLVTVNPEARIFEMLDAVGMHARQAAISSLQRLLASDPRFSDGLYPLTMLVIRFGELLTVKDLRESQGLADREAQATMKMPEWRYRRLRDQARLFTADELVRLIQQARDIDWGIKRGAVEPVLSLEMLILDATRPAARPSVRQRERNRSRIR